MTTVTQRSMALSLLLGAYAIASAHATELMVRYGDLNLDRPMDLAVLYRRLEQAADAVCMPVPSYELARFAAHQRCVQGVLEQTVKQIHSPALLAMHHASAGWKALHSVPKPAQIGRSG